MPSFKGFEKTEADQLVAVIDYPEATKHSFMRDAGGAMRRVEVPNPHEDRLDENTFAQRHGVNFSALQGLPFKEEGYDLGAIVAAHKPEAPKPSVGFDIKNGM